MAVMYQRSPRCERLCDQESILAEKKVSTTVYITKEQAEKLKLLHARTKVPIAEYIRQGIDMVLKQHQDKLPGQLPLVEQ